MSLNRLLAQLDIQNGLSVIPVGDAQLLAGDPKTPAGRKSLLEHSVRDLALTVMLTDNADAIIGDLRAADVLLGLAAQWLLGVDETGTPFVPRTEDALFFDAIAPNGSWFDEAQDTTLITGLDDTITPVFLYKGTLYGKEICVTLGEIFSQDVFAKGWCDQTNICVLPPKPHMVALLAGVLTQTGNNSEMRDILLGGLTHVVSKLDDLTNDSENRIISVFIDWIRDKTFHHGPQRATALWTDEDASCATTLLDGLPTDAGSLRQFNDSAFTPMSAHETIAITAQKTSAMHQLAQLMDTSC